MFCFGPYSKTAPVVFRTPKVKNNLGDVLNRQGKKQLRIAETEKYAHVTYFLNSQVKKPFPAEKRILIPSLKIRSYAEKPEMSAPKITTKLIAEIAKTPYSFVALNFANPDLVGHSGEFKPTVKAIETIDRCLARFMPVALERGYDVLITGDHGNAEYMIYPNGERCPSHTRNPVPFILVSPRGIKLRAPSHRKSTGGLRDIAPTILTLLKIKKPKEMTGKSLV